MSSRIVRVTSDDFDNEGFERVFARQQKEIVTKFFMPAAKNIDLAAFSQRKFKAQPLTKQQYQENQPRLEQLWSPAWASLSMIGLVAPLQNIVKKNDSKNYIHPVFRRLAVPVAAATIAFSAYNAYDFTLKANYDERTAYYQAAANVTWQVANNLMLPALLMKILSIPTPVPPPANMPELAALEKLGVKPPQMFKTPTWRTYGAVGVAAAIAMLVGPATKFKIEQWFVQRRFSRKDYGSHGHSYETTDIKHDNLIDQIEQSQNEQGDEYLINPINERAYAELFPFFSLAEAVATHEVPFNSGHYQNHEPVEYQSALLQGTLETTQRQGAVPVQSIDTFTFNNKTFGEWSLATPHQLAADQQFFKSPAGIKAFFHLFSRLHPLQVKHMSIKFQNKKRL